MVILDFLEKKRQRDARSGLREARILEGVLERKVIKLIVMRVGYGAGRDSCIGYVEKWLQVGLLRTYVVVAVVFFVVVFIVVLFVVVAICLSICLSL